MLCSLTSFTQITRIKEKVEEQSGVPPPQQRLIFGGRQMYVHPVIPGKYAYMNDLRYRDSLWIVVYRPDDKTARDFGITAGAVLHLVLALRGGY